MLVCLCGMEILGVLVGRKRAQKVSKANLSEA